MDDGKIVRAELPERRATCPARGTEPLRRDAHQIADRAARHQPRGFDERGVKAQQMPDHAHRARPRLRRQERRGPLDAERERLLDQDSQASIEGTHRACHVLLGRRRDDHRVDPVEHAVVELGRDLRPGGGGRQRCAVEPRIDDVGQTSVLRRFDDAGEVLAPASGADERHCGLPRGHVR